MTNYDYIRGLPLEEMAKVITDLNLCENCESNGNLDCRASTCKSVFTEWLKSERKENDDC